MDGFEEFEGEDFEDMPLDKKISAMEYAMALVLKAIGTDDVSHQRLGEYRAQWVIRGAYERMRRTGINPLTGQPIDPDTMPDVNHIRRERAEHPYHEKRRMLEEWRESSAFQDVRESFAGVPIAKAAICFLADASVDVSKAAQMTDDELLEIHGMGPVSLGKLRRFLAEREQYEEEAA